MDGSRETATPPDGLGGAFGVSAICCFLEGSGFFDSTVLGDSIVFDGAVFSIIFTCSLTGTFSTGICFSPRRSTIGAGVFVKLDVDVELLEPVVVEAVYEFEELVEFELSFVVVLKFWRTTDGTIALVIGFGAPGICAL